MQVIHDALLEIAAGGRKRRRQENKQRIRLDKWWRQRSDTEQWWMMKTLEQTRAQAMETGKVVVVFDFDRDEEQEGEISVEALKAEVGSDPTARDAVTSLLTTVPLRNRFEEDGESRGRLVITCHASEVAHDTPIKDLFMREPDPEQREIVIVASLRGEMSPKHLQKMPLDFVRKEVGAAQKRYVDPETMAFIRLYNES